MRHHKSIGIVLTSALALSLAACSGDSDENLVEMSIGLPGTTPIFLSTVMQVAQDEGFFEDEGLDIEFRSFASGADVARAVQSGEIDGGQTVTEIVASVRAGGGSIVGIMGYPDSTFTLASSNPEITTCEDMVDATFAGDVPGTPLYIAAEKMLADCGLTPEDLNSVTISGNVQIDALVNGQADATVLHPELIALAEQEMEMFVVSTIPEVDPDAHYMLLITTDEQIEDETIRENWVALTRAQIRAIEFLYDEANFDAVVDSAADVTTRDREIVEAAMPTYLGLDFWPNGYDGLTVDRIEATIQNQVEVGNIPTDTAPAAEEVIDQSVYEDAESGS